MIKQTDTTNIPTRIVGPIKIINKKTSEKIQVPLATFEKPIWHSVNRGAKVSMLTDGIRAVVIDDCMTRSILLEAPEAKYAYQITEDLDKLKPELKNIVKNSSNYINLKDWQTQIVGKLLFIRFSFTTGDASGHNMTTKAADEIMVWLIRKYPKLEYVSVSSNYCADKKVSAVNGILGRGKYVTAELTIPKIVCLEQLKTTPDKIVALNNKKNLIGSILAGSIRSANAHFANMLLALYLATGQDAANIIEGSQGITYAEECDAGLYFSVTLPNLIVGTHGSGKDLSFAHKSLKMLNCIKKTPAGQNAARLAIIAAATVLCGELSLLAAQTNPGELMHSHIRIERSKCSK